MDPRGLLSKRRPKEAESSAMLADVTASQGSGQIAAMLSDDMNSTWPLAQREAS
jgi:hypothetical protein